MDVLKLRLMNFYLTLRYWINWAIYTNWGFVSKVTTKLKISLPFIFF